jgi:hypothetical protein
MRRTSLLAVTFGVTVLLLPSIASAQDCAGAITAVDQKLQKPQQRDNWNRIQVRLYVAEQFLEDNELQKCLEAVREAETIAGLGVNPETGTTTSGLTQTADPPEEASAEGADQDKDTSPAGANIQGHDAEGWGRNEADAVPAADEP